MSRPFHAPAKREPGPEADLEEMARNIVLRRLDAAPRTRAQLAQTLRSRGVDSNLAERVLNRFEEVGLVDDRQFAQMWVQSRQASRKLSIRAITSELRQRGVDPILIEAAVSQVSDADELRAARQLAERKSRSLLGLPRAAQFRRLSGSLARRGYNSDLVSRVAREALDGLDDEST